MTSSLTDDLAEAAIALTAKEALRAPPGDAEAIRRLEMFRSEQELLFSQQLCSK